MEHITLKTNHSSFNNLARLALVIFGVLATAHSIQAQQPGDLLPPFAEDGRLVIDVDDIDDCLALAWHDGQIFVAGHTTNGSQLEGTDHLLIAIDSLGEFVPSFGTSGIVRGDFPEFSKSRFVDMALQSDGILCLGAGSMGSGDTQSVFVSKYRFSGAIDTTFADGGHLKIDLLGVRNEPGAIDVLSNDDFILCGTTYDSNFAHRELPFIGRINANGIPDSSFSSSGFMAWDPTDGFVDIGAFQSRPARHSAGGGLYSCAALSDQRYAFGGVYNASDYWGFRLVVDLNFGSAFTTHYSTVIPSLSGYHNGMCALNGEAYGIGTPAGHFGPENFVVQQFGDYAEVVKSLEIDFDNNQDQSQSICTDDHGRLLIAGYSRPLTANDPGYKSSYFSIAVLDRPMVRDFGFGNDGSLRIDFPNQYSSGAQCIIAPKDVIYAGGFVGRKGSDNIQDIGILALANPTRPTAVQITPSLADAAEIKGKYEHGTLHIQASSPVTSWLISDVMGRVLITGRGSKQVPITTGQWVLLSNLSSPQQLRQKIWAQP